MSPPMGFKFDEQEIREDLEIAFGDVLAEMAEEIAEEIVRLLVIEDHVVTAQLAKTVTWEISPDAELSYIVGAEAPYALWAEHGIRATNVPFEKIAKWVEIKFGIRGKERDDIAWAIVKKIAKEGIRGIRFSFRATDNVVRRYEGGV